MAGMAKIEFAMGSHGLEWKTGTTEVIRSTCQARLLGVRPGWSINMVGGDPVMEGWEVWEKLHKCKKLGKKYAIWFIKDEGTIRAEQAKASAEKEKKEKEADERRRREDNERKVREDAENKRKAEADAREKQKQEYWEKQNAGGVAAEVEEAAPAEAAPPAEGGEAAEVGGGEAPVEEAPAAEGEAA